MFLGSETGRLAYFFVGASPVSVNKATALSPTTIVALIAVAIAPIKVSRTMLVARSTATACNFAHFVISVNFFYYSIDKLIKTLGFTGRKTLGSFKRGDKFGATLRMTLERLSFEIFVNAEQSKRRPDSKLSTNGLSGCSWFQE